MDFLFQIPLQRPVRISQRYAMAYGFMCRGYTDELNGIQCQTWLPDLGANRMILIEQPGKEVVPVPRDAHAWPEFEVELFEAGKAPKPRPLPLVHWLVEAFTHGRREVVVPEDWIERHRRPSPLQLGGMPDWVQSDETPRCPCCDGPMHSVTQLNDSIEPDRFGHEFVSLPFGSGGVAFAFICDKECDPNGTHLMWQTT